MVWLQFLLLSGVIGFAGYHLSINADQIAEKTGLGRNLAGLILLGTVTSLPELITGVSSVVFTDNPNLAIGDIMGSCVFNLGLVFALDLAYSKGVIFSEGTKGQVLTGALGTMMIAFAGFSMMVESTFGAPSFAGVGIYSYIIPILYVFAMKFTYEFDKSTMAAASIDSHSSEGLKKNVIIFIAAAVVIIICGSILPFLGEKIIHVMGWKSAFVGTVFMAFATSLPEIAVTFSALKVGAIDLAFSNLLGSNLFNIVMLAVDDFAYRKGPLLKVAASEHIITVFSALMMTGIVTIGLLLPPQKKLFNTVSFLSLIIFLLFILNGYIIFKA